MSVKIPISADASQAVSAFNQIGSAIRKAGQEGRQFSELDLSHNELKPFAEDIKRLQSNFEELKKVGRGETAAAVRAGKYPDFMAWTKGYERQFPSEKQRQGHVNAVSNYLTQGTRWQPQPPANEPPPKQGGGGFGGLPIPGMGKMLGIGLGLAGIGKITSMLSQGIAGAQDEAMTLDVFKRQLNDTSTEFDGMRSALRDASEGLELTYNETVKLAQSFAKASAVTDPQRINEEIKTSTGFARSFGLDEKQVTPLFGKSRWLGMTDKNTSTKEMAVMFADAIASGNMWSKADEVMNAIVGWVDQVENVMVDAPNVQAYAAFSSNMNASNRPGLQGQSGTALIAQMDNAIRKNGNAGDAGRNFIWRALSKEGQLSPFQMQFLLEEGMFGNRKNAFEKVAPELAYPAGESQGENKQGENKQGEKSPRKKDQGKTNFENIKTMLDQEYTNPFQKWDAMGRLLGISMHQASALDQLQPGQYGKLGKMLERYQIEPQAVNASAFQGLADVALADDQKLVSLRDDVLKRDDLTKAQRQTLTDAKPGDDLRKSLAMTLADVGREKTQGTETKQAVVDLKNELIKTGELLVTPINRIKELVANIAGLPVDLVEGAKANLFTQGEGKKAPRMSQGSGASDTEDQSFVDALNGALFPERKSQLSPRIRKRKINNGDPSAQPNQQEITIKPLEVIHRNEMGGVIHREALPVAKMVKVSQ